MAVAGFTVVALIALNSGRAQAAEAAVCTAAESDYNGDGLRDTAIADPDASVGGKALAGTVTVAYGGDAGVVQLNQDVSWVPGTAEADARFGKALTHADLNADGCTDLVVGAPYKDVGTARDSGAVYVVHGAPGGLGTGPVSVTYDQSGVTASQGPEAGDLFGYALTGGTTSTNQPFLVIGAPGEDVGAVMDAGSIHYLSGKTLSNAVVTQASTGVWGDPETNDRFGAALASTNRYFAVGTPGEAIGAEQFAGAVLVFRPSLNTSGVPDPVFGYGQDSTPGSDASAEAFDRFGTSVAMVATRAGAETSAIGAQLVVGIPGEDVGGITDAGAAGLFRVNPDKTLATVQGLVHQNLPDVEGDAAAGDFFGQQVALVNTSPAVVASGSTVKFAVGAPGKESSAGAEHLDKGGVQIFPAQVAPGASDTWIDPGWGIPGAPEHQMFAGSSLAGTPQSLLVGVVNPSGSTPGAVYAFDWSVVGGGAPTRIFAPGEGGIPAGGTAFGSVVR